MRTESGFTLVELAIALMVIGLLIGGVLKGQELIENARVTATIRTIKAYDAAAMIFRNTYNALPGDIKRPNRIPNCTEQVCNMGGNGNGQVFQNDTSTMYREPHNFFPHLTKAGMIQGPEGAGVAIFNTAVANIGNPTNLEQDYFLPPTPINSALWLNYVFANTFVANNAAGHYYNFAYNYISGKLAYAMDSKLDDGYVHSGDVFPEDQADCALNVPNAEGYLDTYDVENGSCGILVRAGF